MVSTRNIKRDSHVHWLDLLICNNRNIHSKHRFILFNNMETNACWDDPSELDITKEELFWSDTKVLPKIVDHRSRGTVYSQRVYDFTKMACGTYGSRHISNLQTVLEWWPERDPAPTRRKFVRVYKTPTYDPIVKGSSLQDQVQFSQKQWNTAWYYVIKKNDDTIKNMKQAIDSHHFILTGTTNCSRVETKKSKDKIMVMTSWPWHIVAIIWYDDDKQLFFVRNSSGRAVYDNGHIYLKYADVSKMFSFYAMIPKSRTELQILMNQKVAKKKEWFVHEVRNWVYKWRPK